jgi:hypothetical protein
VKYKINIDIRFKYMLSAGGSYLKSYLLRRQRSGGSQLEASLKILNTKKGWGCGSSGRVPAQQA